MEIGRPIPLPPPPVDTYRCGGCDRNHHQTREQVTIQSPSSPQDPMGHYPQYGESLIELGALVVSLDDGEIGIVTWVDDNPYDEPIIYQIMWADGAKGLHTSDEIEEIE